MKKMLNRMNCTNVQNDAISPLPVGVGRGPRPLRRQQWRWRRTDGLARHNPQNCSKPLIFFTSLMTPLPCLPLPLPCSPWRSAVAAPHRGLLARASDRGDIKKEEGKKRRCREDADDGRGEGSWLAWYRSNWEESTPQ